uniref:Uncharacterized protein n=1 Tax=Anguilla anguilla TaxID=7936 RepID=A0A0E9Q4Z9_ANGAN
MLDGRDIKLNGILSGQSTSLNLKSGV